MGFRLKIRTAFIVILLSLGLLPLVVLSVYSYDRAVSFEIEEVRDRHLLLAQNLSSALSRYETDVRATIRSVSKNLRSNQVSKADRELLRALHIKRIALIDADTGKQTKTIKSSTPTPSVPISQELVESASKRRASEGQIWFAPVTRYSSGNIIHVFGKIDNFIIIADLATAYFVNLGKQINFGEKGHATITDQNGTILAHPKVEWVRSAKNISSVSAVQRMMNGETGVEKFYSPALNGEMIAGLTTVKGAGWGVMIPQPVSELRSKVLANFIPVALGLVSTVFLMLFVIYLAIKYLAKPMERFNVDLIKQYKKGMPTVVPPSRSKIGIVELQGIFDAYNDLARTIELNSKEMEERVYQDPMTGIGNREYFVAGSKKQLNKRIANGGRGVVIFMDLDGFKEVNDIRGHAVGDAFLAGFAQQLYPAAKRIMDEEFRGVVGAHPIIGRMGGDEFAITLPIPDDLTDIEGLCEKLRASFPKVVKVDGAIIPCNVSAGGALYPDQGTSVEPLVRRADVALYHVKANGKGAFKLYTKNNALGGKSEILAAVRAALENNEFFLEYQPKVAVDGMDVRNVEALLRWRHPIHGIIEPGIFLPAVQSSTIMTALGEWVIERAISDMKKLDVRGIQLNVAVNIGAAQFCNGTFARRLLEQCIALDFDPDRMQIEVTEDVMDVSETLFSEVVKEVQQHGFWVGIDDFGKGYSNLCRLAQVSANVIKLDRSIIDRATVDKRIQVILQSAIDMTHALGALAVVEGVETATQVKLAVDAGADTLQGFYYSKSLGCEDLHDWIVQRRSSKQHDQMRYIEKSFAAAS